MKRIILASALMIITGSAFAADPKTNNGNDLNKNCFGQGRSGYASDPANRGTVGPIISDRAQSPSTDGSSPNLNVQLNREYKEACQSQPS